VWERGVVQKTARGGTFKGGLRICWKTPEDKAWSQDPVGDWIRGGVVDMSRNKRDSRI
jgi:hypothetical protein